MSETDYHLHADPTEVLERRIIAHVVDTALAIAGAIAIWWAKARGVLQLRLDEEGRALVDRSTLESGETVDRYLVEGSEALYRLSSSDPTLNLGGQTYVFRFAGAFVLGFLGISLLLWVVLQAFTGSTPGKALTGIRTVNKKGHRPGLVRCLIRWLGLGTIDGFPGSLMMILLGAGASTIDLVAAPVGFIVPLVGFLASLFTRGHRRIGDLLGGTFVVQRHAVGRPVDLDGSSVVPAPASEPAVSSDFIAPPAHEREGQRPVPTVERASVESRGREESQPPPGAAIGGASALRSEASKAAPSQPPPSTGKDPGDRRGLDTLDPSDLVDRPAAPRPTPKAPTPSDLGLDPTEEFDPMTETDGSDAELPTSERASTAEASSTVFETGAPEVSLTGAPQRGEAERESESSPALATSGGEGEDESRSESDADWVYEPQWDEARQTYIVWDGRRREWLQYDEGAGQWIAISR